MSVFGDTHWLLAARTNWPKALSVVIISGTISRISAFSVRHQCPLHRHLENDFAASSPGHRVEAIRILFGALKIPLVDVLKAEQWSQRTFEKLVVIVSDIDEHTEHRNRILVARSKASICGATSISASIRRRREPSLQRCKCGMKLADEE